MWYLIKDWTFAYYDPLALPAFTVCEPHSLSFAVHLFSPLCPTTCTTFSLPSGPLLSGNPASTDKTRRRSPVLTGGSLVQLVRTGGSPAQLVP